MGIVAKGNDWEGDVSIYFQVRLDKNIATFVIPQNERSPLMVALGRTTASLAGCFEGKRKKVLYPELWIMKD